MDRIASAIEKLPPIQAPDAGCPEGQEYRQSDLCAQWKAADAAADSAYWTFWAFVAGMLGLGIGLGTLVAASFAAKFARDAAIHTETGANQSLRAADAAEKALTQAKDVSQADLRAWVTIDLALTGCGRSAKSADLTLHVTLENIGKTPALRVEASLAAYVIPSVVTNYGDLPALDARRRQMAPLMPDADFEQAISIHVGQADIESGVAASRKIGFEPMIVVDGIVFYHTVFDPADAPKRMTSVRYAIISTIQRQMRKQRMAWLDENGPAERAQVTFFQDKTAPIYLT